MRFSYKKVVCIFLSLGFIVSLFFNYQSIQHKQRVQTWKEYSYNQFASGVIKGGKLLGYQTSWYDPHKAALAIGEAAMALNQWSVYSETTNVQKTPHIKEVANYLSYIALILVDPNQEFEGDVISGEQYIKNISKLLVKDITEENKIFNELYHLIPKTKENTDIRDDFFRLP